MHARLLILGSGPAGYTAAIYAARASLRPILIAGVAPGGQLTITSDVENYPGYANAVQGPWLMEQMQKQAEHVGARIVLDHISDVNLSRCPFVAWGDQAEQYSCDSLIICTGAQARWLGLSSETSLRGAGVSACATCDGFFFRDRAVAVVGGGNTAVEEALYLANLASRVVLIHRRDQLRAEKILQDRLLANRKITVLWNRVVREIRDVSAGRVTEIVTDDTQTGQSESLPVDGVFIAIGHDPASQLFAGQLALDRDGYVITAPGTVKTSIAGVFAAGDVVDKTYRQAVTAAAMGCMAALDAERYLAHHQM